MSIEKIQSAVLRALQCAFERHEALGERGLEEVQKNQFGDTALRVDIEAEEAVLQSFTEHHIPVRVVSEEHGTVDIGASKYLAVLDGIDGSALYKKERGLGKYGTMIGLFEGLNPRYEDYLVGGIMQHATRTCLLGVTGQGAVAISDGHERPIRTSGHSHLDATTPIYIDEYWEMNRETFSKPLAGFNTAYKGASCLYYADVAEGLADLALECTRKGNLEIAAAYGLIKEAGGVITDLEGVDIGPRTYLEFGQVKEEYIPVITAATPELAHALIAFIKEHRLT
ncbi:MAG: inositol monophosphatase family protein [bacterium]|nr:inositol monophosphatase family protein [bacterium]